MIEIQQVGIGTDIENIDRFKNLCLQADSNFLKKIFTDNEINYCFSKKDPAPSLAARFSGKEAVVKALGSLGIIEVYYNEIEILKNENGSPAVRIINNRAENLEIKISLSHSKDNSIAFVIVLKKD